MVVTTKKKKSGQFSSIRLKSSSVQSRSNMVFPTFNTVLFLSSSSSSLSLRGPILLRPRISAGEKVKQCSDWEDVGNMQSLVPHTKFSKVPIYRGKKKKIHTIIAQCHIFRWANNEKCTKKFLEKALG